MIGLVSLGLTANRARCMAMHLNLLLESLPSFRVFDIKVPISEDNSSFYFSYDGEYFLAYKSESDLGLLYKCNDDHVDLISEFHLPVSGFCTFFDYPWLCLITDDCSGVRVDLRDLSCYKTPSPYHVSTPFSIPYTSLFRGLDFLDVNRVLYIFDDSFALLDFNKLKWISLVKFKTLFMRIHPSALYTWGINFCDDRYVVLGHECSAMALELKIWDTYTGKVCSLAITNLAFPVDRKFVEIDNGYLKVYIYDPSIKVERTDAEYVVHGPYNPYYFEILLDSLLFSDSYNVVRFRASECIGYYEVLYLNPNLSVLAPYMYMKDYHGYHTYYETSFAHFSHVNGPGLFRLCYIPNRYRINDNFEHPILGF